MSDFKLNEFMNETTFWKLQNAIKLVEEGGVKKTRAIKDLKNLSDDLVQIRMALKEKDL